MHIMAKDTEPRVVRTNLVWEISSVKVRLLLRFIPDGETGKRTRATLHRYAINRYLPFEGRRGQGQHPQLLRELKTDYTL